MKGLSFTAAFLCLSLALLADNLTVQSPITMEQLMRELRLQGGNWAFEFDRPVYAKVVCTVTSFPDGPKTQVTEFISDRPEQHISLFFMASRAPIGDQPKPDKMVHRQMKVKLSSCSATEGTRILYYVEKFSLTPWVQQEAQRGEWPPCLALQPELNKEYILHYYYMEGDPYEAKATICFIEKPEDAAKVEKFQRNGSRSWRSADEAK